jgi:hypothetical protein
MQACPIWTRIAIVKAGNLARPMLVAVDPTPHKLLMVD